MYKSIYLLTYLLTYDCRSGVSLAIHLLMWCYTCTTWVSGFLHGVEHENMALNAIISSPLMLLVSFGGRLVETRFVLLVVLAETDFSV